MSPATTGAGAGSLVLVVNPHLAGASDDPVRAWLGNLRVAIPDQVVTQGPLTVEVTGLSCEGFDVASVTSDSNVVEGTASVSVRGAQCACSGKWAVKAVGLSGEVAARVGESDANLTLALLEKDPGGSADAVSLTPLPRLPSGVAAKACASKTAVASLEFSGAGAGVVNALAPMLREKAAAELNGAACGAGADALVRLLSGATAHLGSYAEGALQPHRRRCRRRDGVRVTWISRARTVPSVFAATRAAPAAAGAGEDAAFGARRFARLFFEVVDDADAAADDEIKTDDSRSRRGASSSAGDRPSRRAFRSSSRRSQSPSRPSILPRVFDGPRDRPTLGEPPVAATRVSVVADVTATVTRAAESNAAPTVVAAFAFASEAGVQRPRARRSARRERGDRRGVPWGVVDDRSVPGGGGDGGGGAEGGERRGDVRGRRRRSDPPRPAPRARPLGVGSRGSGARGGGERGVARRGAVR